MKKLFAAILCIAMLLTLAACSNNNNGGMPVAGEELVTVWLVTEIREDDNKVTYAYDEKGDVLTGSLYYDDELRQTVKWEYADGKISAQIVSDADGELDNKAIFSYNEKGQRSSMRYEDWDGEVMWTTTYSYDDNGNVIERADDDGYAIEYVYDENNRLVKETYLQDGEENYYYSYSYDDNGYLVKATRYMDGEEDGYAIYTNDEHGNPIQVSAYDSYGDEYSTTYYTYTSVKVAAGKAKALKQLQSELV